MWRERVALAAQRGWVDASTALTAGAFAVVGGAAVFALPRLGRGVLLGGLLAFGLLNEVWQAGFVTRHAQAADVAAAALGATVGVGLAGRLPRLAGWGRPLAGAMALALTLTFAAVLALAAVKSEEKTRRYGTGPPAGSLQALAAERGGEAEAHRWRMSTPWYTPERVLGRPDGRRGLPLGATMAGVAGLAAAGLGRSPARRAAWAAAAALPPFAVTVAGLWFLNTPWQGIPAGLALGAGAVAGAGALVGIVAAAAALPAWRGAGGRRGRLRERPGAG